MEVASCNTLSGNTKSIENQIRYRMKRCFTLLICFLFTGSISNRAWSQTTYYSTGVTNFNTLSGWTLNPDGTGGSPSSLNNNVRLVVQNGHTKNTSASVSINRLTIQAGGTVTANHGITLGGTNPRFVIENSGTYIHNNNANVSNTIFNGVEEFGGSSTFRVQNWQSTGTSLTPAALTRAVTSPVDGNNYFFGNLEINWPGSGNWNQNWPSFPTPTYLAAGNFSILSVGDFRFSQAINAQPDVYVAGNFLMNSTGSGNNTLNFSSGNSSIGYLNVNGNVSHANGIITASSASSFGYIWTYGNSGASWNFSGGSRVRVAYFLDGNKNITLQSNLNLGTGLIGAQMVITAPVTLDLQQYTISDVTSGAYISSSGTIRTAHPLGLWSTGQTNRAISNANSFHVRLQAGSTVEYAGGAGQVVSSLVSNTAPFDRYENIRFTGGAARSLEGSVTVNGNVDFSSPGNYLDVAAHTVTLSSGASVSNAGASAYFRVLPTSNTNGRLRWNGLPAAARVFPVGSATHYLPVTVTPATAGSDFSVSVFRGTTTNGLPGGPAFDNRTFQVDAVWQVDRAAGTAPAAIRLDWFSNALEGNNFTTRTNAQIGIWRNDAGSWLLTPPGNFANDNLLNFSSTAGTIASFGAAGTGMAYVVSNVNVLPGRLLSFSGRTLGTGNQLRWEVADPALFSRFEPEWSTDGRNFQPLGSLPTAPRAVYEAIHPAPPARTIYYRLKMSGLMGDATYSHLITVTNGSAATLVLLENPARDRLLLRLPAASQTLYQVLDLQGRVHKNGRLQEQGLQATIGLEGLAAGRYYLRIIQGSAQTTVPFIKL